MPKVSENILELLAAAPHDRLLRLRAGTQEEKISLAKAVDLVRRDPRGYALLIRRGQVRTLLATPRPDPVWSECYRTTNSPAFSPWPGWYARYE